MIMRTYKLIACAAFAFLANVTITSAQARGDASLAISTLRVATINMWSGLDYAGTMSMGEWESDERRTQRFELLVRQLREAQPDVVLLQEGSPIGHVASMLADALDFDEIHQVANAGIRIGPIGIPSNLKEGIAILARRSLHLEEAHTWKLSGSIGIHGDILTIHGDEAIFALAGLIRAGDRPIYIVNAHLSAAPPLDSRLLAVLDSERINGNITQDEIDIGIAELSNEQQRRADEVRRLADNLADLDERIPVIIGGDFNTTLESGELAPLLDSLEYRNALHPGIRSRQTWDYPHNANVEFSTRYNDASGQRHPPRGIVSAVYDRRARAIDHIFLSPLFTEHASLRSDQFALAVVAQNDSAPSTASDHYGVYADIALDSTSPMALRRSDTELDVSSQSIEALPIATYDTDAGFGYGAKGYVLNQLGAGESFDITLFHSTEGERWYRAMIAWPDPEIRHRKVYPIAVDLEIDYDRWINNSFFGTGSGARFDDRRFYSRAPLEVSIVASRGFSPTFVAQLGARFKTVLNSEFQDSARWAELPAAGLEGRRSWASLYGAMRLDTRNSSFNPTRGFVLQTDAEIAPGLIDDVEFVKLGATAQSFLKLWHPTTVLALRIAARGIIAPDIPTHALLSLGGNNTLRGSPQDRYLDRIMIVANAELRFPIVWRFGGVVGYDAGKVWISISELDLYNWPLNPVVGLRFVMDTFVVRLDVGFGRETTGLYFNFGHSF